MPWQRGRLFIHAMPPAADTMCQKRTKRRNRACTLVHELLLVLGVTVALPWQRERLFILAMPPASDTMCHRRAKRRTKACALVPDLLLALLAGPALDTQRLSLPSEATHCVPGMPRSQVATLLPATHGHNRSPDLSLGAKFETTAVVQR